MSASENKTPVSERTVNAALTMLYLCGCALTGAEPRAERLSGASLKELYSISRYHSLTALVCEALSGLEPSSEEDAKVLAAFESAKQMSVRKNLMLDTERANIFAFMEQRGIWYMPLKGVILKDMYPKMGLRQMADNDILFDAAYRKDVRDRFEAQGYEVESYGEGNHDVYLKPPIYNYEMHVSLYDGYHSPKWNDYYKDVKDRLISTADGAHGYRFTDEDFYIYFLAHGFKHFDGGGTGLRFLIDTYVYLEKKRELMDLDYIEGELSKLGLVDFERDCRELAFAIFGNVEAFCFEGLSAERRDMLMYFVTSGTYGTVQHSVHNALEKEGRASYVMRRLFPGTHIMKAYHPMFGHRWLLPIGWIYRAFVVLFRRPKRLKGELRALAKEKKR